jgi:hypothetical protein
MLHFTPVSPFAHPLERRSSPPPCERKLTVNRHPSSVIAESLFPPPAKSEADCRPIGDSMKLETTADQAVRASFEGMARYANVQVDLDSAKCTLAVSGSDVSAKHSASASHSVSLPCVVTKPELVTAEKRGNCVVVTIPLAAFATK